MLLSAGLAVRVAVMVAYPKAFLYTDSVLYLKFSHGWQPDFVRQAGYSMLLKVLRRTGELYTVTALQHLLGLAIATAVYVFLQHRAVPRWASLVAVAPVLLDGRQLAIEHFLLAETMF